MSSEPVITEARPDFDPFTNEPEVSITMNTEGAQTWSRLTGANVGKPVAIGTGDVNLRMGSIDADVETPETDATAEPEPSDD